jgi:hypothetical protein
MGSEKPAAGINLYLNVLYLPWFDAPLAENEFSARHEYWRQ